MDYRSGIQNKSYSLLNYISALSQDWLNNSFSQLNASENWILR